MQEVVCAHLLRSGEKSSKSKSWYTRADRSVIAALAILFVVSLLAPSAVAQVSSRTALRQTQVRHPLSPEVMAMHTLAKRPTAAAQTGLDLAAAAAAATTTTSTTFNSDQGPGPGAIGPGPGCNLFPAPPSVGATVPLSYFGPPPSDVNQSFVGPVQLLRSGTVDAAHGTITLPLYQGKLAHTDKNVWYILTDVSDSNVAAALGLNFN